MRRTEAAEVRGLRDVSYAGVRRKLIDMQSFRTMSDEELVAYAMRAVKWAARYGPAQAYSVSFWFDRKKIGKEAAAACVEYAPRGTWADAHTVEPGDYSLHLFKIVHSMGREGADRIGPKASI